MLLLLLLLLLLPMVRLESCRRSLPPQRAGSQRHAGPCQPGRRLSQGLRHASTLAGGAAAAAGARNLLFHISPDIVTTQGSLGRLFGPVATASSLRTVSMLSPNTRPKTTCLPSVCVCV